MSMVHIHCKHVSKTNLAVKMDQFKETQSHVKKIKASTD